MVLLVLVLVGVMAASFAFHTNARLASTRAVAARLQTRLAAEAGLEKVKLLLANQRLNMDVWYHNPDELHRVIVWMPGGDETVWGSRDEYDDESMIYRFSIVADDAADDEDLIRLGITDESSKLNLNTATRDQLRIVLTAAIAEREEELDYTIEEILDAILDWRDADKNPQVEEADTEGLYYDQLVKPYPVKNGDFETIEELLLVKGMDGRILYGEDQDRNGLLSANEDDGDDTFPNDNGDGFLNRGLYPYITVVSLDRNISNDNRQRINLYGDAGLLRKQLMEEFEEDREKVDFIANAVKKDSGPGGGPGGGPGRGGAGKPGAAPPGAGGGPARPGAGGQPGASGAPGTSPPTRGTGAGGTRGAGGKGDAGGKPPEGNSDDDGDSDDESASTSLKSTARWALLASSRRGGPWQPPPDDAGDDEADEGDDGKTPPMDDGGAGGDAGDEGDEGDGASKPPGGAPPVDDRPIKTPAEFVGKQDGSGPKSPFTIEDLPKLMDRVTAEKEAEQKGLININTAPPLVLRCLSGLSEEDIAAIVARRAELDGLTKANPSWLVTEGVLSLEKFIELAPRICARGTQFTVESLGYADHVGMVTRIQVVYDMRGPLAQTLYYRDITKVGGSYPIRKDDQESIRVP